MRKGKLSPTAKKIAAKVAKQEAQLIEDARERVAQRGLMQFRLDPESIKELYALAKRKRKSAGGLVRDWVLENLERERNLYVEQSPSLTVAEARNDLYEAMYPLFAQMISELKAEMRKAKR
jgi:hypothetical protein